MPGASSRRCSDSVVIRFVHSYLGPQLANHLRRSVIRIIEDIEKLRNCVLHAADRTVAWLRDFSGGFGSAAASRSAHAEAVEPITDQSWRVAEITVLYSPCIVGPLKYVSSHFKRAGTLEPHPFLHVIREGIRLQYVPLHTAASYDSSATSPTPSHLASQRTNARRGRVCRLSLASTAALSPVDCVPVPHRRQHHFRSRLVLAEGGELHPGPGLSPYLPT